MYVCEINKPRNCFIWVFSSTSIQNCTTSPHKFANVFLVSHPILPLPPKSPSFPSHPFHLCRITRKSLFPVLSHEQYTWSLLWLWIREYWIDRGMNDGRIMRYAGDCLWCVEGTSVATWWKVSSQFEMPLLTCKREQDLHLDGLKTVLMMNRWDGCQKKSVPQSWKYLQLFIV